jgi:hypothetical protein
MTTRYSTRATWLGKEYGCRVLLDGVPVLEARCPSRELIAPTFRDLLRTIDKLGGGDHFTSAARYRNSRLGNLCRGVKHLWLPRPQEI